MGKHTVYQYTPGHTLCIASTQSGKTTGLVIPTILDDETTPEAPAQSMLIWDPKTEGEDVPGGEIYAKTAGYRATMSRVLCFQPLHPATHQYNPLGSVRLGTPWEHRDLQMLASMLTDPTGERGERPTGAGAHFGIMAEALHIGVLAYGLHTRKVRNLGDLYHLWCGPLDLKTLMATMEQARPLASGAGVHPDSAYACLLYHETTEKELSAVVNTARNALQLWADPLVRFATARSDFALQDFRQDILPLTLYVNFPFHEGRRLLPLSRVLVRQWLEYNASAKRGWTHPMLAVLDEFQSLGKLPILEEGLNYFLGTGLSMCLITPSLNYVESVWGRQHPFLEGCATQVTFGIRDESVARRVSGSLGQAEALVTRESVSQRGAGWERNRSTTTATETRDAPLISSTAVMDLAPEEVLVRRGSLRLKLTKASYWLDPVWQQRSLIPPPEKGSIRFVS